MKRFAISTLVAGGVLAGMLGTAGAAQADLSDVQWYQNQQQHAHAPKVDTTVHTSR